MSFYKKVLLLSIIFTFTLQTPLSGLSNQDFYNRFGIELPSQDPTNPGQEDLSSNFLQLESTESVLGQIKKGTLPEQYPLFRSRIVLEGNY